MESKTHRILRKKIEKADDGDQEIGAYLTYQEILTLVDYYGVIPSENDWKVRWSRDHVSKGLGGSTWFYFTRNKNSKI